MGWNLGYLLRIFSNLNVKLTLTSTPPRSSVLKPPCMSKSILVVLLIWIIPAEGNTYKKYEAVPSIMLIKDLLKVAHILWLKTLIVTLVTLKKKLFSVE